MDLKVWISEILTRSGTTIKFDHNDIVIIVGPNNSGKTTILRELQNTVADKFWVRNGKILANVQLSKKGTDSDLLEFLERRAFQKSDNNGNVHYIGYRLNVHTSGAVFRWTEFNSMGLGELQPSFLNFITSDARLGLASTVRSIDVLSEIY